MNARPHFRKQQVEFDMYMIVYIISNSLHLESYLMRLCSWSRSKHSLSSKDWMNNLWNTLSFYVWVFLWWKYIFIGFFFTCILYIVSYLWSVYITLYSKVRLCNCNTVELHNDRCVGWDHSALHHTYEPQPTTCRLLFHSYRVNKYQQFLSPTAEFCVFAKLSLHIIIVLISIVSIVCVFQLLTE